MSEEFAVLDRVGRLQLPQDFVHALRSARPRAAGPGAGPRRRLAGGARPGGGAIAGRAGRDRTGPRRTWPPEDRGGPMTTTTEARTVLRAQDLTRVFGTGAGEVHALTSASLEVAAGELLVVRGPSGSGKTTLLNLLGGLDRPTSGSVWLGDSELTALGRRLCSPPVASGSATCSSRSGWCPCCPQRRTWRCRCGCGARRPPSARNGWRRRWTPSGWRGTRSSGRTAVPVASSSGWASPARSWPSRAAARGQPTGQLDSGTAAVVMDLLARVVHQRGRRRRRLDARPGSRWHVRTGWSTARDRTGDRPRQRVNFLVNALSTPLLRV